MNKPQGVDGRFVSLGWGVGCGFAGAHYSDQVLCDGLVDVALDGFGAFSDVRSYLVVPFLNTVK